MRCPSTSTISKRQRPWRNNSPVLGSRRISIEDEACDRVIGAPRRRPDAEPLGEFVERIAAIYQQRAVVAVHDPCPFILFDVGDDRLKDVAFGHDSLQAAVLVDDQHQAERRMAQLFDDVERRQVVADGRHVLHQGPDLVDVSVH